MLAVISLILFHAFLFCNDRGWVEDPNANNRALIVGVSHGLDGLDYDIANVKAMVEHAAYQFHSSILEEGKATVSGISNALETESKSVGANSTLLFYFTGHGNVGIIWPQDKTMSVEKIRDAIIAGRKGLDPIERLVLVYDSCNSGSLLDPMRLLPHSFEIDQGQQNIDFSDSVVESFTSKVRGGEKYWNKLIVFASSRSNESSIATAKGSMFTLAMNRAFKESLNDNQTFGQFISLTQKYTEGHHPVARLVPASLSDELMVP